jgi:hypothetical protein
MVHSKGCEGIFNKQKVKGLPWLPQSLDLLPIENL